MSSGTGNDGFGHRGWTSCSFGTFRCAVPNASYRGVHGVHLTTNLGLLSVRCGPDPTRSCVWRTFRGRTAGNFVVPCMRCTFKRHACGCVRCGSGTVPCTRHAETMTEISATERDGARVHDVRFADDAEAFLVEPIEGGRERPSSSTSGSIRRLSTATAPGSWTRRSVWPAITASVRDPQTAVDRIAFLTRDPGTRRASVP